MCSLILNLGTNWPHRGQASLGGGRPLKNAVIGVVVTAALAGIPAFTPPFFLLLDKDKRRLSLSALALSVMLKVEMVLLDVNVLLKLISAAYSEVMYGYD